jgi:hypothetical protein
MFETKVQFSLDREIENKPFSWNEIFFGAKIKQERDDIAPQCRED